MSIACSLQVQLKCFTLDEVHQEVPMLSISKVVVYTWQVGVCQDRQHCNLAVECRGSFNDLLSSNGAQIELLHSEETIPIVGIFYLVNSPKATLSYRSKNAVT